MFKPRFFNESGTSKCSQYTLKEGYNWITEISEPTEWWPWMNNKWIIPKHLFIVWIIAHKRLLTQTRMQHINLTTKGNCNICDDDLETTNHLFASCRYSREIFANLGDWCGIKLPDHDCNTWWLKYRDRSATKKKIVRIILAAEIYYIWQVRNRAKFDLVVQNQSIVCRNIRNDVISRLDHFVTKTECSNTRNWIERLKMGRTG